jgi:hypothetical protein
MGFLFIQRLQLNNTRSIVRAVLMSFESKFVKERVHTMFLKTQTKVRVGVYIDPMISSVFCQQHFPPKQPLTALLLLDFCAGRFIIFSLVTNRPLYLKHSFRSVVLPYRNAKLPPKIAHLARRAGSVGRDAFKFHQEHPLRSAQPIFQTRNQ